jgi:hypothetical protein
MMKRGRKPRYTNGPELSPFPVYENAEEYPDTGLKAYTTASVLVPIKSPTVTPNTELVGNAAPHMLLELVATALVLFNWRYFARLSMALAW